MAASGERNLLTAFRQRTRREVGRTRPIVTVTHDSASNAHAVSSPVPVGCTSPRRANIPSSSGLVDTGVPHAHAGCAYAHAGCNPHARSADTGGCHWACNTSFGYANGLAINDGIALYLAKQTWIKSLMQYQYGMEYLKAGFQGQALALVGLPPVIKGLNVLISNGRVGAYNKGETAAVSNPGGKTV